MKRAFFFFISFSIIILFSWSYFHHSFFRTHDFTHVARVVEMKRSLEAGQVPPHWSQNLGYGYGMPLFLFYGPFPFFLATLFTWIGFSALSGVKLMVILSNFVAFLGMYRLTRRWGRLPALIAATLYLAAPYRAVDLYVRGALNEAWALSLLPWILHSALQVRHRPRSAVPALAASTALLILTHNLTALFALPMLGLAALTESLLAEPKKWKMLGLQITGWIWGALLSLFYLLPAFMEKGETQIEAILSGYFSYHHHFLYIRQLFLERWGYEGSGYGPDDGISFHLGWPLITLLLLFFGQFLFQLQAWIQESWETHHLSWWQRWTRPVRNHFDQEWVWVMLLSLFGLLSVFMTLTHAEPIWNAVPLLSFVQFPWRFLTTAVFFWSLVAVFALKNIRLFPLRAFLGGLVFLSVLYQVRFHQPQSFLSDANEYYYTDEGTIRRNMSDILPDYLPKGFDSKLPPVDPEQRLFVEGTITEVKGRYERNTPHQILWQNPNPEPSKITWNIAHFPGWTYEVNGKPIEPNKMDDGRMQYLSTEPVEWIAARFTSTPIRTATLWVSTLSFLAWIGWQWREQLSTRKKK